MNEERLQRDINECMAKHDCGPVERIEMARGSDVMNLSMNVDVYVYTQGPEYRQFTFRTREFVNWLFSGPREGDPRPDVADIYTVGGPLLIVKEITGDAIVRGVLRYLELEPYRQ